MLTPRHFLLVRISSSITAQFEPEKNKQLNFDLFQTKHHNKNSEIAASLVATLLMEAIMVFVTV